MFTLFCVYKLSHIKSGYWFLTITKLSTCCNIWGGSFNKTNVKCCTNTESRYFATLLHTRKLHKITPNYATSNDISENYLHPSLDKTGKWYHLKFYFNFIYSDRSIIFSYTGNQCCLGVFFVGVVPN